MKDFDHVISPLTTESVRPGWARVVKRPFVVFSARTGEQIKVPVGFEFDWDSLPRWLPVSYAWLKGRTKMAAGLHDWLYFSGLYSRMTTELIFWDFMALEGVKLRHRIPIFLGVMAGGWLPWRRYRNGKGDGRIHRS